MLTRVYETSFMPVKPRYINVHNQGLWNRWKWNGELFKDLDRGLMGRAKFTKPCIGARGNWNGEPLAYTAISDTLMLNKRLVNEHGIMQIHQSVLEGLGWIANTQPKKRTNKVYGCSAAAVTSYWNLHCSAASSLGQCQEGLVFFGNWIF